jgi:hypothetical protein
MSRLPSRLSTASAACPAAQRRRRFARALTAGALLSPFVSCGGGGSSAADARAITELEYAAAAVPSATDGRVLYQLADSVPSGGVRFDVSLDTADEQCRANNWWAYCQNQTRSGYITGGKIVFCHVPSLYGSTLTHEGGHAFGLFHSQDRRDMMYVYSNRATLDFSAREKLAMHLMLQRPAGNRYPDTDRSAAGSAVSRVDTIGCR